MRRQESRAPGALSLTRENTLLERDRWARAAAWTLLVGPLWGLSGCASKPYTPSQEQLKAIQSVEVLVNVPAVPFSFVRGGTSGVPGTTVYVQPPAGMSVGAGIGVNIVANVAFAAIDYAMTATSREAQGPVSKSVEQFDLAQTVVAQLASMRGAVPGPMLVPGRAEFPKYAPMEDSGQSWIEHAKASSADATLLIRIAPAFRDLRVSMDSEARLITRTGDTLLVSRTHFRAPDHPAGSRAEVVKWWADGRYLRWLRQGVRAAMWPVAEGLWMPAQAEETRQSVEKQVSQLPLLTVPGEKLRGTACALESDTAQVVYRFERQRNRVHAAAWCASEAGQQATAADVRGISWFSEAPPPLVDPVLFGP